MERLFPMRRFEKYCCKSGSPLALRGNQCSNDVQGPDFSDWQLTMAMDKMQCQGDVRKRLRAIEGALLLCCPEDHECANSDCVAKKRLCNECKVPLCTSCLRDVAAGLVPPRALMQNNWQGYIEKWMYEVGLTWMEKTVASPFWTGMTLFCIDLRRTTKEQKSTARRKHLLNEELHSSTGRIQFKGQVFSAPLAPLDILQNLLKMEEGEVVELPVTGEWLKMRCQISITSGLVELNKLLRQTTIRREHVLTYIKMKKDAGHKDFQHQDVGKVKKKLYAWIPTDAATIPPEFQLTCDALLDELGPSDDFLGTDKQATPAERNQDPLQLQKDLERCRPQILCAQRHTDSGKMCRTVGTVRSKIAETRRLRRCR